MSDLIRRSDALNALKTIGIAAIAGYSRIRAIPAVDAVEVKHGHWIWDGNSKRVCSECGNSVSFTRTTDGWIEGLYCQTCGARMDVRRDDDEFFVDGQRREDGDNEKHL